MRLLKKQKSPPLRYWTIAMRILVISKFEKSFNNGEKLQFAVEDGHVELVNLLEDGGAEENVKDNDVVAQP